MSKIVAGAVKVRVITFRGIVEKTAESFAMAITFGKLVPKAIQFEVRNNRGTWQQFKRYGADWLLIDSGIGQ